MEYFICCSIVRYLFLIKFHDKCKWDKWFSSARQGNKERRGSRWKRGNLNPDNKNDSIVLIMNNKGILVLSTAARSVGLHTGGCKQRSLWLLITEGLPLFCHCDKRQTNNNNRKKIFFSLRNRLGKVHGFILLLNSIQKTREQMLFRVFWLLKKNSKIHFVSNKLSDQGTKNN